MYLISEHVQLEVDFLILWAVFFAQPFGQIVSMIRKKPRNTNVVLSIYFKMKKISLTVDVRRSKTPLLKFPTILSKRSSQSFCQD